MNKEWTEMDQEAEDEAQAMKSMSQNQSKNRGRKLVSDIFFVNRLQEVRQIIKRKGAVK